MPRLLRVEYPGALYLIVNRGDRKQVIFKDNADRHRFVDLLGETCTKTGWRIHAYVLMPDHFHLVVETPHPNLVVGMKWLLGVYAAWFNRRHRSFGHLFSGRYKSLIVDESSNGYRKTACDYVHLNPARARLVKHTVALRSFPWSSWPWYLTAPSKRPTWLSVERLFEEYRIEKDSPSGRRQLEQATEKRRMAEEGKEYQRVRRGWCLGDKVFRKKILARLSKPQSVSNNHSEGGEADERRAEQIIRTELKRLDWKKKQLRDRPKGDEAKVALAQRLRTETVQTVEWIAERLAMGSPAYVNHLLWLARKRQMEEGPGH